MVIAIIFGLFLRLYDYTARFTYGHDADLVGWIVKDIIFDKHFRLIGQLTSSPGIFIGALYYYIQIPFYWLSHMDPIGVFWLTALTGILSIASMWYVAGPIASFIYAGSWLIANTERDVFPTTPVFLWSIWFFHTFTKLWNGEKKWLYVAAILISLIWHTNLALVFGVPFLILAILRRIKSYSFRDLILPFLLCLVLNLPLIFFEIKHGFGQTKALVGTLSNGGEKHYKFDQVIKYTIRNANRVFVSDDIKIHPWLIPGIIAMGIIVISRWRWFILAWSALVISFFSVNSLPISEYYLNSFTIVWILGATWIIKKMPKLVMFTILGIFAIHNVSRMLAYESNHAGYVERKAIVEYIKEDSIARGYPCIAISYITSIGNNLGYRYWFWLKGMKVMRPDTLAPVYSIVFPHSLVNKIDKSFGSLGLIFPDYSRYNKEGIAKSCDLPDQNLTESMFGFTK